MRFGTRILGDERGVLFRLYAPSVSAVNVRYGPDSEPQVLALEERADGWFEGIARDAGAGTRYAFEIGDVVAPDPASRFQPDGVHGRSMVVDPLAFEWPDDGWKGLPWNEHVFYELHVGTFTPEGTYTAAQTKLDHLAELGVTAIELMPLSEFPGARNWGYDGVLPYAPSHNYGTPDDLKAFVAAAHARGLAVFLDVVYNHFGPEANYLWSYARNFYTEKYQTPWGAAIDVETPANSDVRAFFIDNALYWLMEYRFDGLRFDAVHAIYDGERRRFLREMAATIHSRADRPVHLVLENEENEAALLDGVYDAQWNDDAHHGAHVAISGQTDGYYADYSSDPIGLLGRSLTQGFGYQGEPSSLRGGRPRGSRSEHVPLVSFVEFLQNHDQIGNRPFGDRITRIAPVAAVRAVSAALFLAPPIPLLFMGEEWEANTPFLFFCDFEPDLAQLVTAGRRDEFKGFGAFSDPAARERIPDPSAAATFEQSKLDWSELAKPEHREALDFYKRLLHVRREQIVPRTGRVRGTESGYEKIGARGLRAWWRLRGETLAMDANLGRDSSGGFVECPLGRVIFATHGDRFEGGNAPPWSVRWTIE
jgi:1,4-alpha-glucan branching enzyme/maltooligosyltrehalose trehalohydrolase